MFRSCLPYGRGCFLSASRVAVAVAIGGAALFAAMPADARDDPFGHSDRKPPPRSAERAPSPRPGERAPAVRSDDRAPALWTEGRCGEPRGISIYTFPERPVEGSTLRIVAVSEGRRDAKLSIDGPDGQRLASSTVRLGGPPFSWIVEVPMASAGTYRGRLAVAGDSAACIDAEVSAGAAQRARTSSMWPVERVWDRDTENLYSAWIAKLFDDAIDASPSWNSLHAVTHDASRNFLHDSLGMGEDSETGITLSPDCADLPYFLRGYFAWKMRLPFVYSRCYSVSQNRAPVCSDTRSNLEFSSTGGSLSSMQRFFSRSVADTAHSATGRTAAMDDHTDVYPVRISQDTLRPGAVYIDPYGHVLVIAKRIDQTPTSSGILFAVDAQPDGTVARKRYWRGTFLFALDGNDSAPGFKRFRPVVPDGNSVRTLDNAEILSHPAYGDWSMEQYEDGVDGFYDKVDAALSPAKRSARQVLLEVVDLLQQQLEQRVASVQGGETYVAKNPSTIGMPSGAAIFQTVGAWEDYATPSRDLRLLIAIDVVRGFPEYVIRRPNRFYADRAMSAASLRGELESMLDMELQRRTFQYMRSDGTPWTLRLADVIERADALEMVYNPNDCVEKRWGAEENSVEVMPCRRHAPEGQVRQMQGVRDWFHTRTRPAT